MAELTFPTMQTPLPGFVQGRVNARYSSAEPLPGLLRSIDLRQVRPTIGWISDLVVVRVDASTDLPFANGRVWLLRLADGFKAWEGFTNAEGRYSAYGLELDVDYIAVGIDPLRNHKATGAGPVRATLPEAS